jgi:hypothetical protein
MAEATWAADGSHVSGNCRGMHFDRKDRHDQTVNMAASRVRGDDDCALLQPLFGVCARFLTSK